ncbi:MAG: 3-oxoacyl-ACP synthase, partial [Helicobacter sp.]|nr:3-oxoacyl-ACP synthase [Helicobacter sp.]
MYAALKSIGAYVPSHCVSNKDLESQIDTTDEWIVRRTGIKTRYFAGDDETSSSLGVRAAPQAIESAHIAT